VQTSLTTKHLSCPGAVRSYALKLMNIIATDSPGRQYLFQAKQLIANLLVVLNGDQSGDIDNAVGTLQKLSFIKDAKTQTIKLGGVEAALKLLTDPSQFSAYTTDYAAAWLMALCMRRDAARRCLDNDALSVLAELVSSTGGASAGLRSYANATLVELFTAEPKLREQGKSLGLPALLDRVRQRSEQEARDQIDCVLKAISGRLTYSEEDDQEDDPSDGELFDCYEEVGEEQWEFDVEGEPLLAKYVITTEDAGQAKRSIDLSLGQSLTRLSVADGGVRRSVRGPPAPGNVLARSMRLPQALAGTLGAVPRQALAKGSSTARSVVRGDSIRK
jgi:hypothetical protein